MPQTTDQQSAAARRAHATASNGTTGAGDEDVVGGHEICRFSTISKYCTTDITNIFDHFENRISNSSGILISIVRKWLL
jgi:hypothetical protein